MAAFAFTPQLLAIFTALVEERSGLAYGRTDSAIFEGKVAMRALEAGFETALDYYYYLRYDDVSGEEMQALLQALVVHETYFFREYAALRSAVEHVIVPRIAYGGRARVWCAACSTGEEPLSLAMLLHELGIRELVDIVASDLSDFALARARLGLFGARAVRAVAPACAAPWLSPHGAGYRVAPALVASIDWRRINLLDDDAVRAVGEVDLVLCRNVLIYFGDETACRVVQRCTRNLRTGGVMLVGVSESLMRLKVDLRCEEHDGTFVYKKVSP